MRQRKATAYLQVGALVQPRPEQSCAHQMTCHENDPPNAASQGYERDLAGGPDNVTPPAGTPWPPRVDNPFELTQRC
jgi:hypothetical protein